MRIHRAPFAQLQLLPALISGYLSGAKALAPFYQYPFEFSSFRKVIANKKFSDRNRNVLADALTAQYAGVAAPPAVLKNIAKLREGKTFTITTAHQPVIFTGPLYFIYKILCAINIAEQLNAAEPDCHFVPVYFMGAEDHDFEEINHLWVGGEKLEWQAKGGGAVGRLRTEGLDEVLAQMENQLREKPYAAELFDIFRNTYVKHETLAKATLHFVNRLFGEYGLVALNPDNRELKSLFTHVIEDEILNGRSFSLATKTIAELEALGYGIQAAPREINLFYLNGNSRERITAESDSYKVLNTAHVFSRDEIIREARECPEKFSPNVMLRPLYQETILPNLAYVGGAGELSYWLEQKSIFDYFKVNFPMLVLRSSALLVDAAVQKKAEKSGLRWEDFFEEEEALVKNFVKRTSSNSLDFSAEKKSVEDLFLHIREKAVAVDTTLGGSAEALKASFLNGLDGFEKKILKAEKRNLDTAIAQVKAVKSKLFPQRALQERVENFSSYYVQSGKQFFQELKQELDPFKKELLILSI